VNVPLVILFVAPVAFILVVVIGLWLYYSMRGHGQPQDSGDGKIYRCGNCGMVYVERRLYPVLECPRCHHPNTAIRR